MLVVATRRRARMRLGPPAHRRVDHLAGRQRRDATGGGGGDHLRSPRPPRRRSGVKAAAMTGTWRGMDRRAADEAHPPAPLGVRRQAVEVADVGEHRHHRRRLASGPRRDEQLDARPVEDACRRRCRGRSPGPPRRDRPTSRPGGRRSPPLPSARGRSRSVPRSGRPGRARRGRRRRRPANRPSEGARRSSPATVARATRSSATPALTRTSTVRRLGVVGAQPVDDVLAGGVLVGSRRRRPRGRGSRVAPASPPPWRSGPAGRPARTAR